MKVPAFSRAAAALAALVGLAALAGWALDVAALKGLGSGLATMKANTALCFVLAGASLWLLVSPDRGRAHGAAEALAWLVVAIAAVTSSEDLLGWNAGIDQLLFDDPASTAAGAPPGRMSPATATSFVLIGAALLLLDSRPRLAAALAQGLAAAAAAISVLALLGYLFGAPGLYRTWAFSSIALHTAGTFLVLSAGILAARAARGWVSEIARDTPGAAMARRLLAAVFIVLPLFAWVRLKAQEAGWFGLEVGLGLMVTAGMVALGLAILISTRALNAGEERILKLSRLYLVLSEINQLLLRSRNRETVMNEACRIAVEVGRFRSTWIALPGEGAPLKVLARSGEEPPADLAPSGEALADDKLVVAGDTAAFPIRLAHVAIGVLGLRASRAELSDREELELLAEVADDVGYALERIEVEAQRDTAELRATRNAERLRLLHEVDRGMLAEESPEAIAQAALKPLRDLLGVPRAIVNLFDLAAGEVEWLAAIGRQRMHVGPGVRYPIALMGELEALKRGEPQVIDTRELPPSPHKDALLASGVELYMAVPMLVGGELIGALSFGGAAREFADNQVSIAREVADQLAIAISHARLRERVERHSVELEQRVRERTADLEAANKELESFSYTVSHDLRAPLRAMDGFARMLEDRYAHAFDAEGKRLLGIVRDASRRMGALIDDLLTFSRLGRQAMAPSEVDMSVLAAQALAELNGGGGAAVRIEPLPQARGDRTLLKQVWANLLSNALKYSARHAAPAVEVTGRMERGSCLYCVSDNGVGFDMRYYEKLFGVFQRLHAQADFPGTGVGLAIVQRIVARHGGRVWAEGKVNEGASFYFSLPDR